MTICPALGFRAGAVSGDVRLAVSTAEAAAYTTYLQQIWKDSELMRPSLIGFILLIPLTLSGCGHNLNLMAADGTMGTGRATGFGGKGTLDVQIGSRSYTGTWVNAQGGSVGFGTVGRTAFTTTSVDANSTGNAMLHSVDGGTLRCQFAFGGMSGTGYGECLDGGGTHYDLQIM